MKKFILMLLTLVGMSVTVMANSDSVTSGFCTIKDGDGAGVYATAKPTGEKTVSVYLKTDGPLPANAQVTVYISYYYMDGAEKKMGTEPQSIGLFAPGNNIPGKSKTLTFGHKIANIFDVIVTGAKCETR